MGSGRYPRRGLILVVAGKDVELVLLVGGQMGVVDDAAAADDRDAEFSGDGRGWPGVDDREARHGDYLETRERTLSRFRSVNNCSTAA